MVVEIVVVVVVVVVVVGGFIIKSNENNLLSFVSATANSGDTLTSTDYIGRATSAIFLFCLSTVPLFHLIAFFIT